MSDPAVPPPPPPPTGPGPDVSAPADTDSRTTGVAPDHDFNIGEEYGTAKKSLPPIWIVGICVGVVVIIAAIYALTNRAHPLSSGTIDDVVTVEVPGQNMVLVAINISIQNNETNPTVIRAINAGTDVNGNKMTDDATPAVDVKRYFEAMPELKQHALEPLSLETRINPGAKVSGTIVVSFPVNATAFAARSSLTVTVSPYNELPIVMKK